MRSRSSSRPPTDPSPRRALAPAPPVSPLSKAPAFIVLVFCAVYTVMSAELEMPAAAAFAAALLSASSWTMLSTETAPPSSLQVSVVLTAICALSAIRIETAYEERPLPRQADGSAEVLDVREMGRRRVVTAMLLDGADTVLVIDIFDERESLIPGDLILLRCEIEQFRRSDGGNGFDEMRYWRARGADGRAVRPRWEKIGETVNLGRLRWSLRSHISSSLPRRTAAYLAAIASGERSQYLDSLHRSSGTSHLLAISGFHVGLVFGSIMLMMKGRRLRFPAASICMWAYALFSGSSPSALRAAFMIQIAVLGWLLGRGKSAFNAAACAGWLLLMHDPWLWWDIGWRLSMAAILTVTSVSFSALGLFAPLGMSALVWLTTASQSALVFDGVPLVGIVLNAFSIAVFAVLFPAAILLSLPALAGMGLGDVIIVPVEIAFEMWERFASNWMYLVGGWVGWSRAMMFVSSSTLLFISSLASGASKTRACAVSMLFPAVYAALS